MKCPFCHQDKDKVVDSRASRGGDVIRRRRQCLNCGKRFTTYERVEIMPLRLVKKDGRRVPFDRDKILAGLMKACEKRPVATDLLERTVAEVEEEVYKRFDREVTSQFIGELVMDRLRKLDQVAYIRFASVYREFKAVSDFVQEAKPMLE